MHEITFSSPGFGLRGKMNKRIEEEGRGAVGGKVSQTVRWVDSLL